MSRRHATVAVWVLIALTAAGVVFPFLQKTRGAAARMTCHGHFKQLALALHISAQQYGDYFPPGTLPHPDLPPEQRLSWVVRVLPNMEQVGVFTQIDPTRGPADPRNAEPVGARFRHLTCPWSGEHSRTGDWEQWKSPSPVTHYVGVAGVGADAATLPLEHSRAGVFGYDRRTALKDGIPDGTSNTLLIIETANEPGHWAFGGRSTVRAFEPGTAPYVGPGRPFGGFHNGPWEPFGPRSHACSAAMADGSVRFLMSTSRAGGAGGARHRRREGGAAAELVTRSHHPVERADGGTDQHHQHDE